MRQQRWQDWVMLAFAAWLFFSPFFLNYTSVSNVAAWNSYVLGAAVAVFSIWALIYPQKWEEWVNIVLALWLIVAPFVLQFYQTEAVAAWNQVILGLLIGGDAIWALAQRPSISHA